MLRRRAALILSSKAKSVKELEELDRLESLGDATNPKNTKEERSLKRVRGESLANNGVGPTGSPGPTAPLESSKLVN